jgi:hypothetical protein
MERVILERLCPGDAVVVSTASGSTYTFTVEGPRYGTLGGGRLEGPTLALFLGAQSVSDEVEALDALAIVVGKRVRFLCPLVGEIVTTAVTGVAVEASCAA